ncbi:MAG: ExbD/TolR family protein [Planctomycetales bacterium]
MPATSRLFTENGGEEPLLHRRPLADAEMDITPMIDCVFQLLIFFMVASNMQGGKTADIPVARFGVGVDTNQATTITVETGGAGGARSRILLDADREADLAQVRQLVSQRKREGRSQVIIKADRNLPHAAVQEVIRAVMETEGVEFFIAVKDK